MDTMMWFQIPNDANYISQSTNTLGKGMNQTILPLAMDKFFGRLGFLTLVWQPI